MIAEMYEDFSRVVHHRNLLEKIPELLSTKMQTTKALTKGVFPAHKKYLLFYFYPTQPRPQIFSPRKGEEPWGQGCINFGH